MPDKIIKYAFRIVHIKNIPHILKYGFVKANSKLSDPNYVPIGDNTIIAARKERNIREGVNIGDCIPFYFGPRQPMLYVIEHGYNGVKQIAAEEIVYCVIKIDDIINNKTDCVFTDGHALDKFTNILDANKLKDIDDYVKYKDVYAKRWDSEEDRDLKRRKEAELLLIDDLPPKYIRGFVVYNKRASDELINLGINPKQIVVRAQYYFQV